MMQQWKQQHWWSQQSVCLRKCKAIDCQADGRFTSGGQHCTTDWNLLIKHHMSPWGPACSYVKELQPLAG